MIEGYVVWPYTALLAAIVFGRGVATATPRPVVLARVVLALYLGWLASMAFFPLPLGSTADAARQAVAPNCADLSPGAGGVLAAVDLVPLTSIRQLLGLGLTWPSIRILVGNVVLFVPIGLLLPLVTPRRLAAWPSLIMIAFAVGLTIELGQLAGSLALGYPYRVTELDDVLLNAAGVVLGWCLSATLARRRGPVRRPAPRRAGIATPPGLGGRRMPPTRRERLPRHRAAARFALQRRRTPD